jgi:hypothetical protein
VNTRRHQKRREEIADFVQSQVDAGHTLAEAYHEAEERFRPGKEARGATVRQAYAEFYPFGEFASKLDEAEQTQAGIPDYPEPMTDEEFDAFVAPPKPLKP